MSIVIFSSDSKEKEAEIAKQAAEALGYELIDRRILKEIATKYNVNEGKLIHVLDNRPSLLKRISNKQWRFLLSCIESTVLERLISDNIVCSGVAAHLYVKGVSHVLKVRVLSGNEQKIEKIAEDRGISLKKGQKWIVSELRNRTRWSQMAYNRNETDPSMYDLVVNLAQIDPSEAVKTIGDAVGFRKFKPMTYSVNLLKDFAISAAVKAVLLKTYSDIDVITRDGTVKVTTKALNREKQKKAIAIKKIAGEIEGVNNVEVHIIKDIFGQAIESCR